MAKILIVEDDNDINESYSEVQDKIKEVINLVSQ